MGARKDAIARYQNSGKVKAAKRRAWKNRKKQPRKGSLSKSGGFRTYDQ